MAVNAARLPRARAAARADPRSRRGVDERAGRDVPARRERRHADAHRWREHLRGPAAVVRRALGHGAREAPPHAALPPEGAVRAARRERADVGRRSVFRRRLPPPPHRRAPAGDGRAAADDGRARLLPAPRSRPAIVGDLDGRGPRARSLGAPVEGPPLHGRRRRRHRSDVGDVRRRRRRRRRRTRGGPAPSRRTSRCSCAAPTTARSIPAQQASVAVRARSELLRGTVSDDARGRGGGADAPSVDVLADGSDRPAPGVELGERPARATSRRSARRSAAPSTTWCWRSSRTGSATC